MRRWLLLPLLGTVLVGCGGTALTPDEVAGRLAADATRTAPAASLPSVAPISTAPVPRPEPLGGDPVAISTKDPRGKKYGSSSAEVFDHPAEAEGNAVVIRYGYGSCEKAWAKVVETDQKVTITLELAQLRLGPGEACPADLHFGAGRISLKAPLGDREVIDGACVDKVSGDDRKICAAPAI